MTNEREDEDICGPETALNKRNTILPQFDSQALSFNVWFNLRAYPLNLLPTSTSCTPLVVQTLSAGMFRAFCYWPELMSTCRRNGRGVVPVPEPLVTELAVQPTPRAHLDLRKQNMSLVSHPQVGSTAIICEIAPGIFIPPLLDVLSRPTP